MKHFLRDIFIKGVTLFGISALYCLYARRKGPLVRVIAFHDVANRKWFEEIIGMLHQNYAVMTPEQFHNKNFNTEKINILITFDDGYQSWIDTCLPVLEHYNMKALFFINSGLLDSAHNKEASAEYVQNRLLISLKDTLTWEGARMLVTESHTIGGHTVNHFNLDTLALNELKSEIIEDKKNIETKLEVTITDFAYPFGSWNTGVVEQVLKAGYTHVYVADPGFVTSSNNVEIRRTLIEKDQSVRSVKEWIDGGYDLFSLLKHE